MAINRWMSLLAAAVVWTALPGAATAQSLDEALEMAYQQNPALQAARARLQALDEEYAVALSAYRPTVTASGSLTAQDSASERDGFLAFTADSDTAAFANIGIDARQLLFAGGRLNAQTRAAMAQIGAGYAQYETTLQGVLLDALSAYLNTLRDVEVVRIVRNNVDVLERQRQAAQDRFDVGEVTRTDVSQAEARLAAARAELASAQAQLAITRAGFEAVIGVAPANLDLPDSLTLLEVDLDQLLASLADTSPALRAATFAEAAAEAQRAIAKSATQPSLSVNAGAGLREGFLSGYTNSESVQIGASVTVPLFTGGLNTARIRQAEAGVTEARLNSRATERTVRQAVVGAFASWDAARARLAASERQVDAARLAFEGVDEEASVGFRTTLDVLDAQQELLNAELAVVTARRDLFLAQFGLLRAAGRLTPATLGLAGIDPVMPDFSRDAPGLFGWSNDFLPWRD